MTSISTPAGVVDHWLQTWWPSVPSAPTAESGCAVLDWAASGGMALTGHPNGTPVLTPAGAFGALDTAMRHLTRLTAIVGKEVSLDAAEIIAGRAALRGFRRGGDVSTGGMTRILRADDGWLALALCRPDDVASVPALIGDHGSEDPWQDVTSFASRSNAGDVVARAQLLGIAAAELPARPSPTLPFQVTAISRPDRAIGLAGARVVDLSSLWAGPLCGMILHRAGAQVTKVESTTRPDGARIGDPEFFRWLHRDQEMRSVDFTTEDGRAELTDLIGGADIVIEASRPRALEGLGLSPTQVAHRPGRIWVSITGGGRRNPMQVDFGDDAAVGGGLVGWSGGEPVFCADAVADPLSGVTAALAVAASAHAGGGTLIDVSMVDTAAAYAGIEIACPGDHHVSADGDRVDVVCTHEHRRQQVLDPRPPRVAC